MLICVFNNGVCVFKNIWTRSSKIFWVPELKKTKVKLGLVTDIDIILLMVEKGIIGGIFHAIHWYIKANNKYMKDYDKNKESSYLKYWDAYNL